jgi:hypothetical protein
LKKWGVTDRFALRGTRGAGSPGGSVEFARENDKSYGANVMPEENKTPAADSLSQEEKKKLLFLKQKRLLDTFFKNGAISRAQYDKSYNDMKEKMGIDDA